MDTMTRHMLASLTMDEISHTFSENKIEINFLFRNYHFFSKLIWMKLALNRKWKQKQAVDMLQVILNLLKSR